MQPMIYQNVEFKEMGKEEAYSNYAPAWLKTLKENGRKDTPRSYVCSVVDMLIEQGKIFKLVFRGVTVGYLGFFYKLEAGCNSCYLEFVYIKEKERKNKLGTIAIWFLQDYCKKRGIDNIRLWISIVNKTSINFFESLGYKPRYVEYGVYLKERQE